jgi:hypothetical protein
MKDHQDKAHTSDTLSIARREHKAAWETPTLQPIGKLRDFVQGVKGSRSGDGEGLGGTQMMP